MSDIIETVTAMLNPLIEGTDMFLVNITVKPTNNIKIFLDADTGLSIEKCARINRSIRHQLEETGMFPDGNFSLEVSSPGVDEPLTSTRQYQKNINRTVAVTVQEEEEKEIIGVLKEVTEEGLLLEIKDKKKKESTMVTVPFANIKKTVVQIVF